MSSTSEPKQWHLATVFEMICDAVPDATAMIHGPVRWTYRDFDDRAGRMASALQGFGVGKDTKVALYLHNCPEYKEMQYAASKVRGIVINVNYRYLEDELIYLLDNSDSEVLVFHRKFADRVAQIRDRLPKVREYIQVDDGSDGSLTGAHNYEELLASHSPAARIFRPSDDSIINYTGGTTGLPKGVMYNHESSVKLYTFGYEFYDLPTPTTVDELLDAIKDLAAKDQAPVCLVCVPFMHGTGSGVGHTMTVLMGGAVILLENISFDPHEAWGLVQRERVTQMVIVGDAIAKPLLNALREAEAAGKPYDISSMRLIASAGVMWTKEVKKGLLDYQDMKLIDFFGSTEGGMGMSVATRANQPETAQFIARPSVKLLDDDGKEIPWGAGRTGRLAATGNIPYGYYKDPEKTARTFLTFDGVRYSVPGDYASIAEDGKITVLGRGSACINTGGEKVFAEEVEEALKRHDEVYDCLVVPIPDDRFGTVVAAVVSATPGSAPDEQALRDFVRGQLSGYKVPKRVFFTSEVRRAPNGKADYKWATAYAAEQVRAPDQSSAATA